MRATEQPVDTSTAAGWPHCPADIRNALSFATPLAAKCAIADEIRPPIGKLSEDDRQFIDALVAHTLSRPEVIAAERQRAPDSRVRLS